MKKSVLFTALLFSTLFISCVTTKTTSQPSEQTNPKKIPQKVETIKIEKQTDYLTTKIQYPKFQGKDLLNTYIQNSIMSYYQQFSLTAEADWKETGITIPFEYIVTYDYISDKKYTGVVIFTYIYSGGAHGGTFITTANYDEENNKLENDITKISGLNYKQISQNCRESLYTRLEHELKENDYYFESESEKNSYIKSRKEWIDSGTTENPGNFEAFIASAKKIKIYFEEYSVAPYSEGYQTVEIDY